MFNLIINLSEGFEGDIDSFSRDFKKQLDADISDCMQYLGEYAQELLEKSIESQLYGSISGHYATGSIRRAHELKINGMNFELYMDASKMVESAPDWNRSYDFDWYGMNMSNEPYPSGSSFSDVLLERLNVGGLGPSPYRDYALPETRYFEHAFEQIESKAVDKLASMLRAKGYNVE